MSKLSFKPSIREVPQASGQLSGVLTDIVLAIRRMATEVPTKGELSELGVIDVGTDGSVNPPPVPVSIVPPQPTGVTFTSAITNVIVDFDKPNYQGHAYTEMLRGATTSYGDAKVVQRINATTGAHPVGPNQTGYYWIRHVSKTGTTGAPDTQAGTLVTTGVDVAPLLAVLTNKITESQLFATLNSRINLVDGLASVPGSVNNRVAAETTARTNALLAEAAARGTAISNEATLRTNADTALASQITTVTAATNTNAAAIQTEVTARTNADTALASQITTLAAKTEGGFDPVVAYYFDSSIEGWSAGNATLSWAAGKVTITATTGDPLLFSPVFSTPLEGGKYSKIRLSVKRLAGSAWDGFLFYATAAHGFTAGFYKQIPAPSPFAIGDTAIIEFDMAALTVGGNDWITSNILQIRIDLGQSASDVFEIDWIAVGRSAPSGSSAAIVNEVAARVAGDSANASQITILQSQTQSRSNLIENSSFANGFTGWIGSTNLMTAANTVWGPTAIANNVSGTGVIASAFIAVEPNSLYTVTGDSTFSGTGGGVVIDIEWYTLGGAIIRASPSNSITASHQFSTDDTYRKFHAISDTSPSNATYARVRFLWVGVTNATVGVRQLKLNRGPLPAPAYTVEGDTSNNTAAIQVETNTRATADGYLGAQYTVRTELSSGGQTVVGGFGLSATSAPGAQPTIDFGVVANKFYVAAPQSQAGITSAIPFIVQTTSTNIGGQAVPAGVYMDTAFIRNGTISNAKIANLAVDSAKIVDASITNAKIGALAVGSANIIDASITNAKIATLAVQSANIADLAVTTGKIANLSVDTLQIAGNAVTFPVGIKLAADTNLPPFSSETILFTVPQFTGNGSKALISIAIFGNTFCSTGPFYSIRFNLKVNGAIVKTFYHNPIQGVSPSSYISIQQLFLIESLPIGNTQIYLAAYPDGNNANQSTQIYMDTFDQNSFLSLIQLKK